MASFESRTMLIQEIGKKITVQFNRGSCEGVLSAVSQDSIQLDFCTLKARNRLQYSTDLGVGICESHVSSGDYETPQIALRSILYVKRSITASEFRKSVLDFVSVQFSSKKYSRSEHIEGQLIENKDAWIKLQTSEFVYFIPIQSDFLESIAFQRRSLLSSSMGDGSKRLAKLCYKKVCVVGQARVYRGILTHVFDDFIRLKSAYRVKDDTFTPFNKYSHYDKKKKDKRKEVSIGRNLLVMRKAIESISKPCWS